MKNIAFSEEHCVMCGDVIPEGRQVCIKCEQKVLEEKRVEEKEKKEDFFKRLYKDKKLQIMFFAISMVVIFCIYFPTSNWIEKNLVEKKIVNRNVEMDSNILAQISDVYLENNKWSLFGWVLHLDSKLVNTKIVLREVDGTIHKVLKTKEIKAQEIEEYAKYLELTEYSNKGFTFDISKNSLEQNVCYEILIYVTYEEDVVKTEKGIEKVIVEEKSKKITTAKYFYNGEIYNYNPLEFRIPEFTDKQMVEVIKNGQLCQYDAQNGVWIYFYDNYLYWVLDTAIESNKEDNLYMFFHFNTSKKERLPEHRREYGWDNRDFSFKDKELNLIEESVYKVARVDLEMEYPITYITTGHYMNGNNVWSLRFNSLCIQ